MPTHSLFSLKSFSNIAAKVNAKLSNGFTKGCAWGITSISSNQRIDGLPWVSECPTLVMGYSMSACKFTRPEKGTCKLLPQLIVTCFLNSQRAGRNNDCGCHRMSRRKWYAVLPGVAYSEESCHCFTQPAQGYRQGMCLHLQNVHGTRLTSCIFFLEFGNSVLLTSRQEETRKGSSVPRGWSGWIVWWYVVSSKVAAMIYHHWRQSSHTLLSRNY